MPKYEVVRKYIVEAVDEESACRIARHYSLKEETVREIKPRFTVRALTPDHRTGAWLLRDGQWFASFAHEADAHVAANYMNSQSKEL